MPGKFLYGAMWLAIATLAVLVFAPKFVQNLGSLAPQKTQTTQIQTTQTQESQTQQSAQTQATNLIVRNQRILDLNGNLAYSGDVDLRPTLARIQKGIADKHANDGQVHKNREGKLPHKPNGYYREYVVRTKGLRSVGPQRLILGQAGEIYYTPNHYKTYLRLR